MNGALMGNIHRHEPIASVAALFFPDYAPLVDRVLFPALLGELWIMLWLVIKGAKVPDRAMSAGAAAAA